MITLDLSHDPPLASGLIPGQEILLILPGRRLLFHRHGDCHCHEEEGKETK